MNDAVERFTTVVVTDRRPPFLQVSDTVLGPSVLGEVGVALLCERFLPPRARVLLELAVRQGNHLSGGLGAQPR
ncbi:hypothetical protein [Streptomyces sclerotialus]|uniref:hypothetical protein n=1 Tax=Streptomyces sclerotialus TaxID=1957 RepID=UPI0018C8EC4D